MKRRIQKQEIERRVVQEQQRGLRAHNRSGRGQCYVCVEGICSEEKQKRLQEGVVVVRLRDSEVWVKG